MNRMAGEIKLKIAENESVNGYLVSIASKGNKLVVGYNNGLIELIELIEIE